MDIEGLGEKQVDVLQRAGLVKTAGDFYRLTPEQLVAVDRIGEVSARRLVERIQASKDRAFGRVLFGMGIEGVGGVTGRNLAQRFRSIDALASASIERNRCARLRPVTYPTPSIPIPKSTRPNGRSFDAWIRWTSRFADTSPIRSTFISCSGVSR